ncbi:LAME_0F08790g1_1 [Lachancea meyersii CBS 8951]|uniref:LAME_0F08790g1_1 n=1 Tax=Lachancea meyersii CBS 8951 TaxID=1266667 RepID=A0A1G4JUS6_9SACH|nr:LAME_0F08790g1_1 [Lachancea meyersii CBS 8951]
MTELLAEHIPEELAAAAYPGPVAPTGIKKGDEHDEPLYKTEQEAGTSNVSGLLASQDQGWVKILYFAGSCSINLILPFLNGLMLGFGELIAHEISWKFNWFKRSNTGYKIYPESRKYASQGQPTGKLEQEKRIHRFL